MNVVFATNDNGLRYNQNFIKLSESYSSILPKLLKDKIITLLSPKPIKEPHPN